MNAVILLSGIFFDDNCKGRHQNPASSFIMDINPDLECVLARWLMPEQFAQQALYLVPDSVQVGEFMALIVSIDEAVRDFKEEPWHFISHLGSAGKEDFIPGPTIA
ncbi:hypothetical protein [Methylobacterium oryzisoli]|uniref:hypothetical protein n=1 Tax=Methylobacterium oryzisoli TaxID=3385502 RepID=UPI003D80A478